MTTQILPPQRTLKNSVSLQGRGLFTGAKVQLQLHPAPVNHGIVFRKLEGSQSVDIPAVVDSVFQTPRCTILGNKDAQMVCTEHLLSALFAHHIDNVLIEITGSEVPIMDGSAEAFCALIEEAGFVAQEAPAKIARVREPVVWNQGPTTLVAIPANTLQVTYFLQYPDHPVLGLQEATWDGQIDSYCQQIAPCRTFATEEEVQLLMDQGLLKGGSLNMGVVFQGERVLNPGGLRFKNEPARHKILDLCGDISLLGCRIYCKLIAIRSGHRANVAFGKHLKEKLHYDTTLQPVSN